MQTNHDIEKLRMAQLMIAREIKRICEKHNIKYFLDSGSLLGAVRHNGFIPWDDDIDIGMLKEDYEKFIAIAPQELNEKFFLDNDRTNPKNPYVFSKLRLRGTTYLEKIGNNSLEHNEIFVDIFPYYYRSENKIFRKIEGIEMLILSQALLSKSGYKVWKGKGWKKRLKFIPTDFLGTILSKNKIRALINRLYNKNTNTSLVGIQAGSDYGYWFFEKNILEELIPHVFEGDEFDIPKEYDTYLKQAYGDYMKLPPEEERITHNIKLLDFGEIDI
jgi:lipopolysaccharide cholinephosphotransferase